MKKKILIVVDMQNDFIDGSLGTQEAKSIVENVCKKITDNKWNSIYVTMDTHYTDDYLLTQEGTKLPVLHCLCFSNGWCINREVILALNSANVKYVELEKETFGCIDLINELVDKLGEELEITLVGVCTDICVISNALLLKAHYPDVDIIVDSNCCAGTTVENHEAALKVMKSCLIDVV